MIQGKENAVDMAIERARRTREAISVVQVDTDSFVLWREVNLHTLPLVYTHYKVIRTIRIRQDDFR